MNYKKPDNVSPDEKLSFEKTINANNFSSADDISLWLRNEDTNKETFSIERELIYEDPEWNSLQSALIVHEVHVILDRIENYLDQDFRIQWAITYTLNEIMKNSVDHAKSDAYVKLEVSEVSEGVLVTFIAGDKGPGIKQHLINLFGDEEFIDKYSKNSEYRQQIIKVITEGNIDEYYEKHLSGKGVSTRVDHRGGELFAGGKALGRAIDELGLDLIMRDCKYEKTFANRGGDLSHDKIRDLPYNLVYYGAKLLSKKPHS